MKQTIFLVAGCPSTDVHAAQFIRTMRTLNPNKQYDFVGIGGPEMKKEGFQSIGVESNKFLYKPFFPWKNFRWLFIIISIEAYTHPVHAYTHIVNWPKYSQILDLNPTAFVTFENQFFMKAHATKQNLISAPTFYWGLTHVNELFHHQNWLDHFFTRLPNKPSNWGKFVFPNTQVGWDGLFRAYRYIFSHSDKYKALTAQKDHIFLPAEHHNFPLSQLLTELVHNERDRYRNDNGIGSTETLLFLATGNTEHEIKWSIQKTKDALEQLFKLKGKYQLKLFELPEMQGVPKETFRLIVSVPPQENLEKIATTTIGKLGWPIKTIVVNSEDNKFGAIAASDIGLAVNGQIVAELAGLQLPTIVLDPEPFLKSYYRSLWNSYCLDLNIAIRGEAYPELLGSSIPMKIALTIQELYADPKLRYYYVTRYEQMLRDSLSPSSLQPNEEQKKAYSQTELVGYKSGMTAMAETVAKAADVYQTLDKTAPTNQQHSIRVSAMKGLGWARGVY